MWDAYNLRMKNYFESKYEDISEPLKEFTVHLDGSMTEICEPKLLGVKKNGKWGWVNASDQFVIPAIYDSGFVLCYDGVIILAKDGKYGGLYSSNYTNAFQFKYKYLSYLKGGTYIVTNDSEKQALARPGDRLLTNFDYIGFLEDPFS